MLLQIWTAHKQCVDKCPAELRTSCDGQQLVWLCRARTTERGVICTVATRRADLERCYHASTASGATGQVRAQSPQRRPFKVWCRPPVGIAALSEPCTPTQQSAWWCSAAGSRMRKQRQVSVSESRSRQAQRARLSRVASYSCQMLSALRCNFCYCESQRRAACINCCRAIC